ncbi:SpoIIE family protein phosphatase [Gabonibacter massiliensis]|uniref:SpoIIE family protein phosphatase n=1 Tax=Gabonibacter massiliensis TaxID=1720195 RepID=UPI000B2D2E54|nr:SpoIIE family protein phosphatase [Gabonibacter massiliensis]
MFKRIERSFSAKLSFYLIASMTVWAIVMFSVFYHYAVLKLERDVDERIWNIAEKSDLRLTTLLRGVEKIPKNMAWMISNGFLDADSIFSVTRRVVEDNDEVFGCAIAFEPNYFKSKGYYFAPYSYMSRDSVITVQLGDVAYNYFEKRWYARSKKFGISRWSQPYREFGDHDIITSTYSVPMYDSKRRFIGIFSVDLSTNWLTDLVDSIKPYPSSYAIVIDSLGNYIVHKREKNMVERTIFDVAEAMSDTTAMLVAKRLAAGKKGKMRMLDNDEDAYVYYMPLNATEWYMAIVCPYQEIYREFFQFNVILWVAFLIIILMLYIISSGTIRRLTAPLKDFAQSARTIALGRFDTPLPVIHSRDEMAELRDSFEYMQQQLTMFIERLQQTTSAKEKIESELRIAHDIQMGLLPKPAVACPKWEGVELYAVLNPARQVGGDFYDYFVIGDELCFAIGDVSGKGVPASLLMATTLSLMRSISFSNFEPQYVTNFINQGLLRSGQPDRFVTFFVGMLHLKSGKFKFCNAGHSLPVMIQPDHSVRIMEMEPSLPLGILKEYEYKEYNCSWEPGAKMLLYTDGITEAENVGHKLYSPERLLETIRNHASSSSKGMIEAILIDVNEFVSGALQSDDQTLLSISFYPETEE